MYEEDETLVNNYKVIILIIAVAMIVGGILLGTFFPTEMRFISTYFPGGSGSAAVYSLFLVLPLCAFLLFAGFVSWQKYRKIQNIPTSKIRSMAAGLVELIGKVTSITALTSPITKTKCVYYKVLHEVYQRDNDGGYWETVSTNTNATNFYLNDGSGSVEINPKQADVEIKSDFTRTSGSKRDIEYCIAAKDTIYVIGTAKLRPGVKSAVNAENFIIAKGDNDPFFYIGDKSEKDAVKKLKMKAQLLTALAIVGIAWTIYVMLAV